MRHQSSCIYSQGFARYDSDMTILNARPHLVSRLAAGDWRENMRDVQYLSCIHGSWKHEAFHHIRTMSFVLHKEGENVNFAGRLKYKHMRDTTCNASKASNSVRYMQRQASNSKRETS